MYRFSSGVSSRRWTVARKAAVLLAASCAVLLFSVPLFSQANLGRITGSVTDASGGAIVGATVTDTDVARGVSRTVTTDSAGQYAFPGLNPGTHKIHVEAKGFKTTERANVPLIVGGEVKVDMVMQPGEVTETVVVTETVPTIDTTSATLGGTLQNEVINDLPLNGRNFENLLQMRPGVAIYSGGGGWTQSTNGLRPHDNMYMVDGIDSNDPWMGQSVMNAAMAAGDAGTILPIDAIQEFHTEQNPKAEFGWKPGSVVNVGIKSGTNGIHGTAYAYGRDGGWDAQDWNPYVTNGTPPPLQVEQFGASIGGPIKKDKLFYFANFEQQRYEVGNPASHLVPSTSGAGALDPKFGLQGACLAALGAGTLAPLSAQLAGLNAATCAPLSSYPGLFPANAGPAGSSVQTAISSVNEINSGVGKIDWHPREKDSISGMYFISPGSGTFVDNPGLEIATPWLTNQYARSQVGSGSWVHTFSSSLLNEFRGGLSHYYQTFLSNDSTQNPANYQFNGSTYHIYSGQTNPAYFGIPNIQLQGGFQMQFGLQWPKYVGPNSVINLSDQMSWLHGTHALKYGVEFLDNMSTNDVTAFTKGRIRFAGLQNFFTGNVKQATFASGDFARNLSSQSYAAFIEDDWRIKPRLTLNLGLRYELNTVLKEANDLIGNFSPTMGLEQVGKQISSPYNGDHNNFAPRLGFAWDVAGNGKTVVRGGAGLIYEQATYDSMMALGNLLGLRTVPTGVPLYVNGSATPITAGGNIDLGAISYTGGARKTLSKLWGTNSANNVLFQASPACGDGSVTLPNGLNPGTCTIMGVDPNIRTPYVTSWNLGIQRAITNDLTLDVSYVGNHATKLWNTSDLNQPRLVNGFSPGWGNPADPNSGAGLCLASAATGYDNCSPDPTGLAEQAARPYATKFPYLDYIMWLSNAAESNYNSLQVVVTQRTAHGLSFTAGYTYAHALSNADDNWTFLTPTNSFNPRGNYGNSQFDIRHNFTLTTTYALPGIKTPGQILQGWSINSVLSYNTGMPWGVNDYSTDFSGTNEVSQPANPNGEQWNFYGNPQDFKTNHSLAFTNGGVGGIPYFGPGNGTPIPAACMSRAQALGQLAVASLTNLGCYVSGSSVLIPPAFGSYGTTARNMFPGPGFFNWDFSVTKEFKIKERLTTQFRAEAFNILNHPNISNPFGGPGGDNTYTDPTAVAGAGFGFRPNTPDVTSSNPILGSGGARAIQLGLKLIF